MEIENQMQETEVKHINTNITILNSCNFDPRIFTSNFF